MAQSVSLMPDHAFYWYGNLCTANSGGWTNSGWTEGARTIHLPTFQTNDMYFPPYSESGDGEANIVATANMISLSGINTIETRVKASQYRSGDSSCGQISIKPDKNTYSGVNDAYVMFTTQNTDTSDYVIISLDVSSITHSDYICLRTFKSASMYVEALVGIE